MNKQLDSSKINFPVVTSPSLGTDYYVNQFIQYNRWTDYNAPSTYQKSCSSNSRDNWTTNLNSCSNGYVKVDGGAAANGADNCLIFNEWSGAQFTQRYSPRPEGCSAETGSPDFNNVQAAAGAYYNSFNAFSASNTNLINQIQVETTDLNGTFTSMTKKLLDLIINIDGIISPLVDLFNKFVGKAGIFQLVNCSKLK